MITIVFVSAALIIALVIGAGIFQIAFPLAILALFLGTIGLPLAFVGFILAVSLLPLIPIVIIAIIAALFCALLLIIPFGL